MQQRQGKTHKAALVDSGDKIRLIDLIRFCEEASADLQDTNEDAAIYFENISLFLREDFRGGSLKYTSRILGL